MRSEQEIKRAIRHLEEGYIGAILENELPAAAGIKAMSLALRWAIGEDNSFAAPLAACDKLDEAKEAAAVMVD
jgi:hypothetical protein